MDDNNTLLRLSFLPPISTIQPTFWEELYDRKLNYYKLDEQSRQIQSFYTKDGWLFSKESFVIDNVSDNSNNYNNNNDMNNNNNGNNNRFISKGNLSNLNTKTQFQEIDKKLLIDELGKNLIDSMINGEAVRDPSILLKFKVLSFADLKTYSFTYWVCIPAIVPLKPFTFINAPIKVKELSIGSGLLQSIYKSVTLSMYSQHIFVIMKDTNEILFLKDAWTRINDPNTVIIIIDMGDDNNYGWSLRNLLALLSINSLISVKTIALRNPFLSKISILKLEDALYSDESMYLEILLGENLLNDYRIVGWEYNQRGKPGPRSVNCSNFMDTKEVMAQAVDLNIKLMKWRAWSSLDTEKLQKTKCLLFGAGTLGCAVARTLIGWGVKEITFVDNGRVSYSNPVRQCLFEFEDCEKRAFKSEAAAERLKKIFPGIDSKSFVLTIPMPGHPLSKDVNNEIENSEDSLMTIKKIDELVQSHDVCFALTDSREARWLPTMLCARYNKLMINAALGFDSYLVMRHGHGVYENSESEYIEDKSNHRLGCYFCNDIVAATNSQKDRSLDQQCTVTRPGLSFIAAALSVEIMVSILHSPYGNKHPGPPNKFSNNYNDNYYNDDIDPIPHQIRGSLQSFTQINPSTPNFSFCTACSFPIVENYRLKGSTMINDVCNDPNILETISGIEKMNNEVNLDLCIDSDDEF